MLISQVITENMTLAITDGKFADNRVDLLWQRQLQIMKNIYVFTTDKHFDQSGFIKPLDKN
jgi:hypothetical protein